MLYRQIIAALTAQQKDKILLRLNNGSAYNLHTGQETSYAVKLPGGEVVFALSEGDKVNPPPKVVKRIVSADSLKDAETQTNPEFGLVCRDGALVVDHVGGELAPISKTVSVFEKLFVEAYLAISRSHIPAELIKTTSNASRVVYFSIDKTKENWSNYYKSITNANLDETHKLFDRVINDRIETKEAGYNLVYEAYYSPVSGAVIIADVNALIELDTKNVKLPLGDLHLTIDVDPKTKRVTGDFEVDIDKLELNQSILKLLKK